MNGEGGVRENAAFSVPLLAETGLKFFKTDS